MLRRSIDLGEAVHEVEQRQPVGAEDVLLAGAAGQHDLLGKIVDLRILLDQSRPLQW